MSEATYILQIIKDGVTIAATTIAAVVAILGLKAWRAQLKGKTEYDLARRLLIAVYKIRNAIYTVRQPFKPAGEIYSALKDGGYEEKDILDENRNVNIRNIDGRTVDKAVYVSRWKVVDEANAAFEVEYMEAEAMWGKEINDVLKDFIKCRTDLYIAIRLLIEIEKRDEENMAIISGYQNDDKDEFGKRLTAEVNNIENYLRQYL